MATATPSHPSLKRAASSSAQIRVVVRIRPFLAAEVAAGHQVPNPCVSLLDDAAFEQRASGREVTVHIKDQLSSRNECYNLDAFFGHEDDLGEIFDSEVKLLLPGIFRGLNATVFAYGATGSGKTYTMQGTEEHQGLIPQAISTLLDMCQGTDSSVQICYYEIYLDRCYDLLEPKAKEIPVLEDKDGNVKLKGLCLVPIHSKKEFDEVFSCGVQRRKVAHTGLNDVSSRSHAVLSIVVSNGSAKGKLNLIDLAGNEDNRRTCNEGIRLQESAKINQSLFALSNVIWALNNHESWVPYRDSKLTRILQDSLGGTSRSLMVACLNPGSYLEAVHTVSLAARSRHVGNYVGPKQETPKVKVDREVELLAWLESKGKTKSIQRLNGLRSPFLGNTPVSASGSRSRKINDNKSLSSVSQSKAIEFSKGSASRKLFDSTASILAIKEEKSLDSDIYRDLKPSSGTCGDELSGVPLPSAECSVPSLNDQTEFNIDESNRGNASEPTPTSNADVKFGSGMDIFRDALEEDISSNHFANRPLENTKDIHTLYEEYLAFCSMCDQCPVSKTGSSPLVHEKANDLQSPIRKVLSPVNNTKNSTRSFLDENFCNMEPKTPKTAPACRQVNGEPHTAGTPLDKFNERGSNLKDSLAKEYLAFLNVASKEELLALKGIGQKRADCIFELREMTPQPFKSLADLEKIGVSSKQAYDLFRRAARSIFS